MPYVAMCYSSLGIHILSNLDVIPWHVCHRFCATKKSSLCERENRSNFGLFLVRIMLARIIKHLKQLLLKVILGVKSSYL